MTTTHDASREVATSPDSTGQPKPRKRATPMVVVSVIIATVLGVGIPLLFHSTANKALVAVQGGGSSTAAAPDAVSGGTTETTLPTWGSPVVDHENVNENPTQVASDLSKLLAGAYETSAQEWAVDFLNNVYACRDASCGYMQAVAQIGSTSFREGIPGDIVRSTGSPTGTPGEVTGTIWDKSVNNTMTGTFTASWNSTAKAVLGAGCNSLGCSIVP